jgi:hypothetical protein
MACVASAGRGSTDPCLETILRFERLPRLGERLTYLEPSCTLSMAASAQLWPSYEAIVSGIKFTVGVDSDTHVRFVATTDPAFAPPEGLHIGDAAAAAIAAAPAEAIVLERGWGHYIQLPSGWYALIADSKSNSSGQLEHNVGTRGLGSDARVTMFFMRE